MKTKDAILTLRKRLALSQDEFAQRLFVTRQAVSRWENGETVPAVDTLKLMAQTFHISADTLLCCPTGQCQSCGMSLELDSDKGTERDGSRSEEYCAFCYQHGAYTQDITLDEMIESNLRYLDAWNKAAGLSLTEQEARGQLKAFLPTLKRWKEEPPTSGADL